jgi:hypothetical protein
MPRLTIQQNNFTAGEVSPRLYGRTDIDKYPSAAKTLVNAYPVVHGGAKRRGGTRYTATTKFNAKRNRLIPFVFSRDDAYMLEFGDNYLRVFKAGGVNLAVELATPYTEAMLSEIDYAQSPDEMFVFHPSVPTQRKRRFSDTYFDISAAPFTATPFAEQGYTPAATCTLSLATVGAGRTATASANVFLASDVGRRIISDAGLGIIVGYVAPNQVTVDINIAFPNVLLASGNWLLDVSPQSTVTPSVASPVGGVVTLTGGANTWRTVDVGNYVKINGGLVRITGYTDALNVSGVIIKELGSTVGAPALSWELQTAVWSSTNGYPRTGTIHEQRLVVAGTTLYPQTLWGSKIGDYLDYTLGTADDDAYSFTIASDEVNPISYVTSLKYLVAHTYGGEFSLQGGVEKPITPTNVRIKQESPHGSKGVRPVTVGRESVFVQRSGRKLRSMGYSTTEEGFRSPDLTVLAEHITAAGDIVELAFQQEPDLIIWAVRSDGTLLSCTFDRDQQVTAWAKHYTEGAVESVACIPNGSADEVWVTVRRTVNGATVRYIEIIDDTFQPLVPATPDPLAFPPADPPVTYGYTVDCGIEVTSPVGQSFIVATHLVGKTVDLVADGAVMPQQVVPPGGVVTIPRNAFRILAGLHFRSEIGLLTPETGTGTGTAQGNSMRTSEVTVRLLNTLGCQVYDGDGGLVEELSFRQFGPSVLDQVPAPFSGLKRAEKLGWERGRDELSIVQDQPLPMHVTAVIRKFQVND